MNSVEMSVFFSQHGPVFADRQKRNDMNVRSTYAISILTNTGYSSFPPLEGIGNGKLFSAMVNKTPSKAS